MTTIPVTDIANEYAITTFSEDGYPSNKNYELTRAQMCVLRSVNERLLARGQDDEELCSPPRADSAGARSPRADSGSSSEDEAEPEVAPACAPRAGEPRIDILLSDVETVIERRAPEPRAGASLLTQTPSLSAVYDKEKRLQLLEEEVATLRKRRAARGSDNLTNFTNILFNKNPLRGAAVNKRMVIVNYASMNQVPLSVEDLEDCSDDEIDHMYKTIKQYHEVRKKKLIVTNFIIIVINVLEQVLLRLGFEDIKGLSAEVTSELIDVEIGEDCEQIATRLGISNNPALNIALFVVKLFIRRIRIL
ncbi:viral membrane formation protein [Equine molluscum contagiosum-like virus]|nr:viral membrane formation protein [Equine molluscum contagiosum-like virus]